MIRRVFKIFSFVVLSSLALSMAAPVLAASNNTKSGLTVSPPFQEITLLQNQAEVKGTFGIANNNADLASFDLSAIDMGTLDDTGGVVFSGLSADYQKKYGLAEWIKLPVTHLTIGPKSTQAVNFSIINSPNMGPGGHYGAIVIKALGQTDQNKSQVDLSPQAATLLFVHKVGGEKYGLSLQTPSSKTYYNGLPDELKLSFKNTGNVHVVPRGVVTIKDARKHEVARGIINPESSLVLPEKTRSYTVPLHTTGKLLWPGTYTVTVQYRYDGIDKFTSTTFNLGLVNVPFIAGGLLLLALLGFAVFGLWRLVQPWVRKKWPKKLRLKPAPKKTFMSVRQLGTSRKKQNKTSDRSK